MANRDGAKGNAATGVANGVGEDAGFEPLRLLSTQELSALIGLKTQSIRALRLRGGGPRYIRIGGPRGRACYRPADVAQWLEARTYQSTAEEAVARSEKEKP